MDHKSLILPLLNAVQNWCTYYRYHAAIGIHLATGNTQNAITVNSRLFEQWFSALPGSGSIEIRVIRLGIDGKLAVGTADFFAQGVHSASDSPVACLMVAAQLLANNHLPPAEIQSAVRMEFKQGSLQDLYLSVARGTSISERAFVEKINQLN
jgi:hypothetical protein